MKTNIQFHMLPEEVVDLVVDLLANYPLSVELERYFPKTTREVGPGSDLRRELRDFGKVDRFWLCYRPPRSRKPVQFMLDAAEIRGRRLGQALFGGAAENADASQMLRKIASELRRRTTAGVWVIGATGNVGYASCFRVSEGAARASREGRLELTGIAFTQSFRVDPPPGGTYDETGKERGRR